MAHREMAVLTPIAACLVFAALLVVAAAITFATTQSDGKSRVQIFITTLASLGIFVTFMFYYNIVAIQQDQQRLAVIEQTRSINASVLETYLGEVRKSAPIIPAFTLELMPLAPCSAATAPGPDPVTAATCIEKFVLSYKIFAIWQDYIMSNSYIYVDPHAYVNSFLQRASSRQLEEMWLQLRGDFDSDAVGFGDLLFEYAGRIQDRTPEAFLSASHSLVKDPRYLKLVHVKKSWLVA